MMNSHTPTYISPITSAIGWLQDTLIGTIATTGAIIAIASIGLLLLSGRIDVRRVEQVVFGCFITFGASTIASGILSALPNHGSGPALAQAAPSPPPPLPSPPATTHAPSTPYDPYAGAALPPR